MTKQGTILIVDDNKSILSSLKILLSRYFEKVIIISSPNLIDSTLRENRVDVVLLDMNFTSSVNSGNEGIYWLNVIKKLNSDIQVVLFTAYAEIELAVEAIKQGAVDFIVKPWDNDKLIASLQNAYNLAKSKRDVKYLKEVKNELIQQERIDWGTSPAMKSLQKTIHKISSTDANVLITGENGTGKEMLAREIHLHSLRKEELLITIDMGSLTETLFESELFGHVKGAFTGAVADRAGKLEIAQGGTLFLDEIGNIPYSLQSKLLTALQSGIIVRVGGNQPIKINSRIICATNSNLRELVAQGKFREDLLYRINTIHVEIPSLRDRKEDISHLVDKFLAEYSFKYNKTNCKFSDKARKEMLEYNWMGNIRELRHTVEKAVILSDDEIINTLNLTPYSSAFDNVTTIEEMEQKMIIAAIDKYSGNMSAAASELGITRPTLYNKIKKHSL